MIIFGTRGVTYTKQHGEFHCPQCRAQSAYKQKRVRRFFTLYFIPVIPLDLLGEYVECPSCRGTYRTDVLSYDPNSAAAEFEAEFHRGLKRVMIEMLLADGVVDDEEVKVARDIYQQVSGVELNFEEFRSDIDAARSDNQDVAQYLAAMAPMLNDAGKELIMKGAFLVSAADGEFQEQEQQLVAQWAAALGMSRAHVAGIISEFQTGEPLS